MQINLLLLLCEVEEDESTKKRRKKKHGIGNEKYLRYKSYKYWRFKETKH